MWRAGSHDCTCVNIITRLAPLARKGHTRLLVILTKENAALAVVHLPLLRGAGRAVRLCSRLTTSCNECLRSVP